LLMKEMDIVASDPNIDIVVLMPHMNLARRMGPEQEARLINYMTDFALHNPYGKPVVIVFHTFINEDWENELMAKLRIELPQKGIAVYNSLSGAARSLSRFCEYHRIQREIN
jgi:acyl-CoA synthetase (NDP forming)